MAHFKTLFYLQRASAARWGQQPCWGTPACAVVGPSVGYKSKVRTHKEPMAGGREPPHSGGRVVVGLPHNIKHFEVAVAGICRYIITFKLFDSARYLCFSSLNLMFFLPFLVQFLHSLFWMVCQPISI